MNTQASEEYWKEWTSLGAITQRIPEKYQRSFSASNLEITCVAAFPSHLVLGTNVGLVYLAHLPSHNLIRLKCENQVVGVSSVCAVATVDDMVAAGGLNGTLTLFQLSKDTNHSQVVNYKGSFGAQAVEPIVNRFTVASIHHAPVTCSEWSKNGMKLFSGDSCGVVAVTEVNYQTCLCTARELFREQHSIVQLSYNQQLLAVSTLERTIIYNTNDGSLTQVGQKPRKYHGPFGCVWSPAITHLNNRVLYVSRSGLRLWTANCEGTVSQTLLFRDVTCAIEILLKNPSTEKPRKGELFAFGVLRALSHSLLVSHNKHWLFVLDASQSNLVAYSGSFSDIIDIAVCKDMIYVLESSRNVICISTKPLDLDACHNRSANFMAASFSGNTSASPLRDIGSRIISQGSGILGQLAKVGGSVVSKVSEQTNGNIVTGIPESTKRSDNAGVPSTLPLSSNTFAKPFGGNWTSPQKSPAEDVLENSCSRIGLQPNSAFVQSANPGLEEFRKRDSSPSWMSRSVGSLLSTVLTPNQYATTASLQVPEVEVIQDLEEKVTCEQIIAREDSQEPLVSRERVKKKRRKKDLLNKSPDAQSLSSNRSFVSDTSENYLSDASFSTIDSKHSESQVLSTQSTKAVTGDDNYIPVSSEVEGGKTTEESCRLSECLDRNDVEVTISCRHSPKVDDFSEETENVTVTVLEPNQSCDESTSISDGLTSCLSELQLVRDHRTYDDFRPEIEEKESLLADMLDLNCLRKDHNTTKSPDEELESQQMMEAVNSGLLLVDQDDLPETDCSTPSTIKEQSPFPETVLEPDFYSQFHTSLESVESSESFKSAHSQRRSLRKKDGTSLATSVQCESEDEDGCERNVSNTSEDRFSSNSYGPPSGSSVGGPDQVTEKVVLQPITENKSLKDQRTLMKDSSDVADISLCFGFSVSQEYEEWEELCGGWSKHPLPSSVFSLCFCNLYQAFLDDKGQLFHRPAAAFSSAWKKSQMSVKASEISVSPNGDIVWLLCEGDLYAVLTFESSIPAQGRRMLVSRGVEHICVSDNIAWFIKKNKKIGAMYPVSNASPASKESHVSNENLHLVQLASGNQVLWGLTSDGLLAYRIGMSDRFPLGHSWGVMADHHLPIYHIHIANNGVGWIIDSAGGIYFRPGISCQYPQGIHCKWWQISVSSYIFETERPEGPKASLWSSEAGIWLAEHGSTSIYSHPIKIEGHHWRVLSSEVWSVVSAEGLYSHHGGLACLSPEGQLFVVNPKTTTAVDGSIVREPVKALLPLELSTDDCIVTIAQRPESLWVLTSRGKIFIRVGLSVSSLHGSQWEELDLNQISFRRMQLNLQESTASCGGALLEWSALMEDSTTGVPGVNSEDFIVDTLGDVHLCHLSIGTELVWAVDEKGLMYMRQGSLLPVQPFKLPPAWIQLDDTPLLGNAVFTKVFVGVNYHMIWALDSNRQVYVRDGIFPEWPIGTSWVHVPGLQALHLSISEKQVWALTPGGEVFYRDGVTDINYIGDSWKRVPGSLAKITSTVDNHLWGLDNLGRICQHEVYMLESDAEEPIESVEELAKEPTDWELL